MSVNSIKSQFKLILILSVFIFQGCDKKDEIESNTYFFEYTFKGKKYNDKGNVNWLGCYAEYDNFNNALDIFMIDGCDDCASPYPFVNISLPKTIGNGNTIIIDNKSPNNVFFELMHTPFSNFTHYEKGASVTVKITEIQNSGANKYIRGTFSGKLYEVLSGLSVRDSIDGSFYVRIK